MKLFSSIVLLSFPICSSTAATYYWTSGGDGASTFAEENWSENSDGSGAQIPLINPNVAVNHDLIVSQGTPGGGGGASASLVLGTGSLTINAGTFRMNTGQSAGISDANITLTSGRILTHFLQGGMTTLSGGSLQLYASGNPIDGTTINFTGGSSASIIFISETVSDVAAEHLSKITVDGSPAVASGIGQNVVISAAGFGSTLYLGSMNPTGSDDDQDGLSNGEEAMLNTSASNRDTDGDGTPDGLEIEKGLNPLDDSDGLDRPNIIFFFVDDLGYGDLGCFWQDSLTGGQKFDTPGIDMMAAEGAKMTHHYISAPVCAPSRASLLQGRHQGHADVRDSQFDRALVDNHSLADTMRRAGYHTIHVGKNGVAGGENSVNLAGNGSQNLAAHPLDRGFDDFFGYLFHGDGHEHFPRNGASDKTAHIYDGYRQVKDASVDLYTTDAWTAYAKKSIIDEVNDGDGQPFFMYVAYETPHFKMQRPSVAYPVGRGFSGGIHWTTDTDAAGNVRYASTADGTGAIDGFNHPESSTSWPTAQQQHVGMIRRIDNSIADIIQLLKDMDIDDNTLCVFTSDNGPHNEGNNPRFFQSYANLEGIKRDMLEGGIRVPTVVRWPRNIAGTTNDENNIHEIGYPSSIWDWMPTFADLAEVPAPSWCDGVSLVPTLTGTGTQRDKGYLYFEFNTTGNTQSWTQFPNHRGDPKGQMQCVRIGDHMGIRTAITSADNEFKIYDAVNDPGQAIDLATSLPDLQMKMKEIAIQARRPGTVSRPYDSTDVPSVTTATEPGIEVTSYEGIWSYVPEFRDLTAASTAMVANFDLTARSREEHVGLLFEGLIQVPTTGAYTFFLDSDSGANLYIHDAHVIDDDYAHTGAEKSASINLEAGAHPIRIHYRHSVGVNHELDVSWSGPGITKAVIPDSALAHAVPPAPEPVGVDDTASTSGGAVDIVVLENDLDDGVSGPLEILTVENPKNGSASIVGDVVRYTPDAQFYGTDRFSYTLTDGAFSASAEITVSSNYVGADLWIPLNECEGDQIFEAGGGILGTATGFADVDSARVTGVHGNALSFDGVNGAVSLSGVPAANLPSGSSPRTIMAWVKTEPAQENATILGYGANVNGQRFSFRTNASAGNPTNHRLRLEVQGGAIVGSTNLNDGQWHHVAAVCGDFNDDDTINVDETKLYVDGVADRISTVSSRAMNTAAGTTAVLGGSNHSATYSFAGEIDELRIFPEALSAAEVQALASATRQSAEAWHRENFGPVAISWNEDLDGDGLTRLAEYAFGTDPYVLNSGEVIEASFDSQTGQLEAVFPRRIGMANDLIYTAQLSEDLLDWESLTVSEDSVATHVVSCLEGVTFYVDELASSAPGQFIRMKVDFSE